jgi:hypothetical protein
MGLKGSYDFKGITISDAYLQVTSVSCDISSQSKEELKDEAVYNSDGTIKTEAVYQTTWTKQPYFSYKVKVFKDKELRDENPNGSLTEFSSSFVGSLAATAKNPVKQAYEALKLKDEYKDYTDV